MKESIDTFEPLLDLNELAAMLRRSPGGIKNDLRRNPNAVPPRLTLPNCRLLRWRRCDVAAWLDQCAHQGNSKGGAQ